MCLRQAQDKPFDKLRAGIFNARLYTGIDITGKSCAMISFFPSLISGDLLHLADCIDALEPQCDGFHIDVMDFHFVPNLTWGPDFVSAIRTHTKKRLWVDLLVQNPEKYLDRIKLFSGDIVSVHYESVHAPDIFENIRARGLLASIAIDPKTDIVHLYPFLSRVDHILLMSVVPGFSGQPFVPQSIERLCAIHELCAKADKKLLVGIDGGVHAETLPSIVAAGVDTIALASAIFDTKDPAQELSRLRSLVAE